MQKLKIEAVMQEGIDSKGIGFPESVTITNAGFLAPSALTDIAQEVLNGYYGTRDHNYIAELPYVEHRTDNMTIKVNEYRNRR